MQNLKLANLKPDTALDVSKLKEYLISNFNFENNFEFRITKQSIDARKREVKVNLEIEIYEGQAMPPIIVSEYVYPNVSKSKTVLIVGAGPAGLFAALRLIEFGLKPIVLERGKEVRNRRRDIAIINKDQIVNPESNYCFGEGGAGTFSDGKLYTRSKKRGDIRRILEILVAHGATEQILVDAHPHIGTNKLPMVVTALRESILKAGGEVIFDAKVTDFILANNEVKGLIINNKQEFLGEAVILATGHSARDIFELLENRKVRIDPKSFAMGVRVEHAQNFVDQCQYHSPQRGLLPAASYSLVAQSYFDSVQRGVFSFCMCPGGFIVPASTEQNELVVNGMSPSKHDSKFANSGIVVAVNEVDWRDFRDFGNLAALQYQKSIEQNAYNLVLKNFKNKSITQSMPAQRIGDFLNGKVSNLLNETSYQAGLVSMNMHEVLPEKIAQPLLVGLKEFGKKIKKYDSNLGQLIGIESRTSSPVRIPRDKETLEHITTQRLFPCGEGAGYAGGIVSAAMDGERCAEAILKKYF